MPDLLAPNYVPTNPDINTSGFSSYTPPVSQVQQIRNDLDSLFRGNKWKSDAYKEGLVQQYTQSQQNAFNIDMWNRENAYNLPINQMVRYQDAGLNPNLIYGQSNTSASAPTSAQGQSWNFAGSTRNKISKFQAAASALMDTAQFANQLNRNLSEIKYRQAMTDYMKQKSDNEQYEADKNFQAALQQKLRTAMLAYRVLGPRGFKNYLSMIDQGTGTIVDQTGRTGIDGLVFNDVLDSIGYSMEKSGLNKSNATIANLLSSAALHDAQTTYTNEGEELRRQEKEYQDVKKGAITRIMNGDITLEDLLRVGLISMLGL